MTNIGGTLELWLPNPLSRHSFLLLGGVLHLWERTGNREDVKVGNEQSEVKLTLKTDHQLNSLWRYQCDECHPLRWKLSNCIRKWLFGKPVKFSFSRTSWIEALYCQFHPEFQYHFDIHTMQTRLIGLNSRCNGKRGFIATMRHFLQSSSPCLWSAG